MAINLDTPVVIKREQRLGTIIAWDGKASDLSNQSEYSRKGCGTGCGEKGNRLCDVKGPFTQGSVCSEQMVECQAGNVRDAVLIQHSPIGCGAGQVIYNSIYRNGLAMRKLPVENLRLISTNLKENDMVFGGVARLEQSIRDAWDRHHPKAIFIGTSCATGIIGDDVDGSATKMEAELGIPVIPLHCEGFMSKHWSTGFDATQHGIMRQIVRKNPKKQEDLVNIINLWGTDIFTEMFAQLDLRVNYVIDMATVDELAQMSEAAATVGFCHTLSSYLAAGLEQEFGVPEIKAPQQLRKQLQGKKGFVSTGSAYAHGLIAVLKELGIEVDGSLVFHHDPVYDSGDPRQDSLAHLVDTYGDVPNFSVSNRQQYQFYGLLQRVKPDFILIRHNGLAPLASRLGIPAAPLGDEHHALGYQGMINLGETILEVMAHRKFHEDLAAHVKLPYKKWWLEQPDPYLPLV
jgi:nitrogenase molybdenum-iron protein alpha chain